MARKRRGKSWTPERLAKFQATMAAKRNGPGVTSIPLDAIPARPVRAVRRPILRASTPEAPRQQLALEIVRLLAQVLGR